MNKAEYMKEYRARNRQRLLAYYKTYYHNVRKSRKRPTRRTNPNTRCFFCEVRLVSPFGSKRGKKYCDGCRQSKQVQRHLNAVYQKRSYYIRVNRPKLIEITPI